jgi:hypothetical protein
MKRVGGDDRVRKGDPGGGGAVGGDPVRRKRDARAGRRMRLPTFAGNNKIRLNII